MHISSLIQVLTFSLNFPWAFLIPIAQVTGTFPQLSCINEKMRTQEVLLSKDRMAGQPHIQDINVEKATMFISKYIRRPEQGGGKETQKAQETDIYCASLP